MTRALKAGQLSRILTVNVDSGEVHVVHESETALYEAPNWALDGEALYVNGDGGLFRLSLRGDPSPVRVEITDLPDLNNDHVLDPDGAHVFLSAADGHIYRAPLSGGRAERVTRHEGRFHFLHGVRPDGGELAYIGLVFDENGRPSPGDVYAITYPGGADRPLTDDDFPDDGAEYSPDGEWIYFNSERARTRPGHAQLFRVRVDGTDLTQLTTDERVNWFPHVSPDGRRIVYLSYPPGTEGHPADVDVLVRVCDLDGAKARDVRLLFGGQGTMNVPCWSPDGTRIAIVEYPLSEAHSPGA